MGYLSEQVTLWCHCFSWLYFSKSPLLFKIKLPDTKSQWRLNTMVPLPKINLCVLINVCLQINWLLNIIQAFIREAVYNIMTSLANLMAIIFIFHFRFLSFHGSCWDTSQFECNPLGTGETVAWSKVRTQHVLHRLGERLERVQVIPTCSPFLITFHP